MRTAEIAKDADIRTRRGSRKPSAIDNGRGRIAAAPSSTARIAQEQKTSSPRRLLGTRRSGRSRLPATRLSSVRHRSPRRPGMSRRPGRCQGEVHRRGKDPGGTGTRRQETGTQEGAIEQLESRARVQALARSRDRQPAKRSNVRQIASERVVWTTPVSAIETERRRLESRTRDSRSKAPMMDKAIELYQEVAGRKRRCRSRRRPPVRKCHRSCGKGPRRHSETRSRHPPQVRRRRVLAEKASRGKNASRLEAERRSAVLPWRPRRRNSSTRRKTFSPTVPRRFGLFKTQDAGACIEGIVSRIRQAA